MWISSSRLPQGKYRTLLSKEQEKREVQEGLIKACDVIDLIIEILRGSRSVKDARACLMYGITDEITVQEQNFGEDGEASLFYGAAGDRHFGDASLPADRA